MSFFEIAIRELWTVQGRKDGKWWKTKTARWKKAIQNTRGKYKNRKTKSLKEISKLTGYPVAFLKTLLNYERIDENGDNIKKNR